RSLAPAAAHRVLADAAVAAHHAVAGDQQRNRILAERRSDGPNRVGTSDLACDPAVGTHLPARNLERLHQDRALELREAAQVDSTLGPLAALQLLDEPLHRGRRSG